jgi:hypothetical protein
MSESAGELPVVAPARRVARIVFVTFLLTFIASRLVVILIMSRRMPDFFLHLGGTHVHHLNYGIFLLSAVGAVLLFENPMGRWRFACAVAYGFGMALTFDEFGMWLHLGGSYWQRASFDAVIVVLSLFGIIAYWPPLAKMRAHHWIVGAVIVAATLLFYVVLFRSLNYAGMKFGPTFQQLEQNGPS